MTAQPRPQPVRPRLPIYVAVAIVLAALSATALLLYLSQPAPAPERPTAEHHPRSPGHPPAQSGADSGDISQTWRPRPTLPTAPVPSQEALDTQRAKRQTLRRSAHDAPAIAAERPGKHIANGRSEEDHAFENVYIHPRPATDRTADTIATDPAASKRQRNRRLLQQATDQITAVAETIDQAKKDASRTQAEIDEAEAALARLRAVRAALAESLESSGDSLGDSLGDSPDASP